MGEGDSKGGAGSVDAKDEAIEEVEPEVVGSSASHKHHPPPPPRLRKASRPLAVSGDPKLARDLMTRELFTIGPDDSLASLEQHMETLHFRHLPVVDGDKPVGLITHSDLLHASSSHLTSLAKEVDELVHQLPAKRIMRTEFPCVRPEEPIVQVAATLWNSHAECVLVTDDAGSLVGIITEADFVRLAHHLLRSQS
jgi:CBS domain-containing protein